MKYIPYRDFTEGLQKLYQSGGSYQKAAIKVQAVLYRSSVGEDPFQGIRPTKHGEGRIPHCVKYDLDDFCRPQPPRRRVVSRTFQALCGYD